MLGKMWTLWGGGIYSLRVQEPIPAFQWALSTYKHLEWGASPSQGRHTSKYIHTHINRFSVSKPDYTFLDCEIEPRMFLLWGNSTTHLRPIYTLHKRPKWRQVNCFIHPTRPFRPYFYMEAEAYHCWWNRAIPQTIMGAILSLQSKMDNKVTNQSRRVECGMLDTGYKSLQQLVKLEWTSNILEVPLVICLPSLEEPNFGNSSSKGGFSAVQWL